MTDNVFQTLILHVHFLGIESLTLAESNEGIVLLYFCREPDSADVPLSISRDQARQLYRDLEDLFTESIT